MNILTNKAITVATLFIVMAFSSILRAQTEKNVAPNVKFVNASHNFGIITEEGGEVYHQFVFTNEGNSPLVITRVTTDCGCTTTNYTRTAVEAGGKGFINVVYDPMGRPGAFVKNIQVYTNVAVQPFKLQITGNVTTRGGVEGSQYVDTLGSLQISSNFLAFPAVSSERSQVVRFSVFNTSNKTVQVALRGDEKLVSLSQKEFTLEGKQPANVMITTSFDPNKVKPSVYLTKLELTLKGDGQKTLYKEVTLKLPVVPDFSKVKSKVYPRADLTTYYDLGKVIGSDPVVGYFEITNQGEGSLELLDVYCPNAAIAFRIPQKKAEKGEMLRVEYRIDTVLMQRLNESFDENVDLILNDPRAPYRRVKIRLSL